VCRWSGIARPVLRTEKSSGLRINRLSHEALQHPWFAQFARELPDHQHFHVVDNRLFDLILEDERKTMPLAFDPEASSALTMVELARDPSGAMPRFLAFNHHPEIVDLEHVLQVLDEKRTHGEVDQQWYDERVNTMLQLFGEKERQSRLTSHYTLFEPLRFHLRRAAMRSSSRRKAGTMRLGRAVLPARHAGAGVPFDLRACLRGVEVDSTFYAIPDARTVRAWSDTRRAISRLR
jgi:hypothetical protein